MKAQEGVKIFWRIQNFVHKNAEDQNISKPGYMYAFFCWKNQYQHHSRILIQQKKKMWKCLQKRKCSLGSKAKMQMDIEATTKALLIWWVSFFNYLFSFRRAKNFCSIFWADLLLLRTVRMKILTTSLLKLRWFNTN